ncbi:MAG TPA: WhiB family transcriptional regulator [Frankiaceae bacterium]|jgi:hypothetical protein|nr:WhiB family transcriptional regulator [Frankiaceae bacterium]
MTITAVQVLDPVPHTATWLDRAGCTDLERLFDDESRAAEAVSTCRRCPVMQECRSWAVSNAVHGVAGAMTAEQRRRWRQERGLPEPVASVDHFMPPEIANADRQRPRSKSPAVLDAVRRWTDLGLSGREIAERLDVTRRTVVRLRNRSLDRAA